MHAYLNQIIMKLYYCTIFICLIIAACDSQINHNNTSNLVVLSEEDLPPLQQNLKFEKINLPEDICMASDYLVYHDSILVVIHYKPIYPDPYTITVMNINTMQIVGRFLRRGNGPDEVLNTICFLYENRLNVKDLTRNHIIIFDMDKVISLGQSYKPEFISLSTLDFNGFDKMTDTSVLLYNSWYLNDCGNKANENVPELIVSSNEGRFDFEKPEDAAFVANSTGAFVISSTKHGKFFLAYNKEPKFSLLDSSLNPVKILYGPAISKEKEYEEKDGTLKTKLAYSYAGFAHSTENYVFIGGRNYCVERELLKNAIETIPVKIYQFDWEGNMVARYQMPYGFLKFSVSESTNTLYITCYDEDGEPCLYKAQL